MDNTDNVGETTGQTRVAEMQEFGRGKGVQNVIQPSFSPVVLRELVTVNRTGTAVVLEVRPRGTGRE